MGWLALRRGGGGSGGLRHGLTGRGPGGGHRPDPRSGRAAHGGLRRGLRGLLDRGSGARRRGASGLLAGGLLHPLLGGLGHRTGAELGAHPRGRRPRGRDRTRAAPGLGVGGRTWPGARARAGAGEVGTRAGAGTRVGRGSRQPRQYTISSGPRGDSLRVTIKRVRGVDGAPDGQVSNWLYEHAQPGAILDVSQPAGDVLLDESDAPLVLVSAGIGITPIAAILEDLSRRQPQRTVRLFHADRSHDTHALYSSLRRQVLAMSDARAQNWYEEDASEAPTLEPALHGFMDLSAVELPSNANVFMCGPLPFMRSMRETLIHRGIPSERINYEVFGPDLWAQNPPTVAS